MSIHHLPGVSSHVGIRKGKGHVEVNQTGKGEEDQTEQGKMELLIGQILLSSIEKLLCKYCNH